MQTGQQPASLDLGGEWSFAYSLEPPAGAYRSSLELVRTGLPLYRATVPGNLELDLQAAGIIGEPFYGMNIAGLSAYERAHVWYSRRFLAVFEKVYRFTPFSDDAQPRLRGKSPPQPAGDDVTQLPMTAICNGWAFPGSTRTTSGGVPNT